MAVNLPAPGDQPPWGSTLNTAIEGIDADLQGYKATKGQANGHAALDGTGKVPSAQLPAAAGGVTAHNQLTGLTTGNDHTQYQLSSAKGQASGYASLGTDGKVPSAQLPAASGGSGGSLPDDMSGTWFAGKIWYALGTSITIDNSYTGKLQTMSGMSLLNKGVGGASLSTASNGNIWTALTTQVATDAEVITMENINDFRLNVPLGTVADTNQATSYYGALRAAAAWILTNRPAARAFWFTAYGDSYVGYPNGNTTNSHGKYYWEYNDAMRNVGRMYGIPVIEVGGESGINFYTCQFYTTDMIHMNALGGTRYAEYVWPQMRTRAWLTSRPTAPGAQAPVSVTGVTIVQGSAVAVAPTQTMQLSASIAPANASNKGVVWASSAPSKVTVSSDGLITGVAAGTSNITVTTADGGFVATAVATCAAAAVTGVTISPKTFTLMPTQTQQLTPTVAPTNASNKAVTYASSATGVATVNSSGLVTGVANGTATITVTTTDGSFTDTTVATISSTVPVTSVSLDPDQITVSLGGTTQLTATVLPANATTKTVTYQSSNMSVATVNASGLVTTVASGTATITVTTTDGSKTDTSVITVAASAWNLRKASAYTGLGVTGLSVDGNNDPTWSGTTWAYPTVILNDFAGGDNACEFTCTGSGVGGWLVVGTDGTTKFCAAGDANPGITLEAKPSAAGLGSTGSPTGYTMNTGIGAFADGVKIRMAREGDIFHMWKWNGSTWAEAVRIDLATQGTLIKTDPAAFAQKGLGLMIGGSYSKVRDVWTGTYLAGTSKPLTGITITPSTANAIVDGATVPLAVAYTPTDATNKSMTWASSAPLVATVNSAGIVTAVAVGTATITGTSVDGGYTDTCVVTVTGSAGAEWVLNSQTTFRDNNLEGLTATGSNPTYTSVTMGTYGAILVNTPGDNAIEFAVANDALGMWLVTGTGSADGTFFGVGDLKVGITHDGQFNSGGIVTIPVTKAPTNGTAYVNNKVYRLGRSGTKVKLVRMDPTPVVIWDADLATESASSAANYTNLDIGIMAGSSYSKPINCKTGVWTPP